MFNDTNKISNITNYYRNNLGSNRKVYDRLQSSMINKNNRRRQFSDFNFQSNFLSPKREISLNTNESSSITSSKKSIFDNFKHSNFLSENSKYSGNDSINNSKIFQTNNSTKLMSNPSKNLFPNSNTKNLFSSTNLSLNNINNLNSRNSNLFQSNTSKLHSIYSKNSSNNYLPLTKNNSKIYEYQKNNSNKNFLSSKHSSNKSVKKIDETSNNFSYILQSKSNSLKKKENTPKNLSNSSIYKIIENSPTNLSNILNYTKDNIPKRVLNYTKENTPKNLSITNNFSFNKIDYNSNKKSQIILPSKLKIEKEKEIEAFSMKSKIEKLKNVIKPEKENLKESDLKSGINNNKEEINRIIIPNLNKEKETSNNNESEDQKDVIDRFKEDLNYNGKNINNNDNNNLINQVVNLNKEKTEKVRRLSNMFRRVVFNTKIVMNQKLEKNLKKVLFQYKDIGDFGLIIFI